MRSKIVVTIMVLAVAIYSCSDKTADRSVTITGSIEGLTFEGKYQKKDTLFLNYNNIEGERIADTILILDGEMVFNKELDIESLTMGRIFIQMDTVTKWVFGGYYPSAVSRVDFLLYPGAKISIEGVIKDYVDAFAYDGGVNDLLAELAKKTHPIENEAVNKQVLVAKLDHFTGENYSDLSEEQSDSIALTLGIQKLDKSLIDNLQQSIEELSAKSLELKKEFVRNNTGSRAAAYVLSNISRELEHEEVVEIFNSMGDEARSTPFGTDLNSRIIAVEATKIGNQAPSISGTTHTGEEFNLDQLKGKVVLIDFWGSWCGPCMAGMPKLKELYAKYEGELEILGIASDSEKPWRETIERDKLNWVQILDAKSDIAITNYNITGFPTKFILDREGKIVYKEIGEDENSEIGKILEELISK